jgi:MFS family permease
VRRPFSSGIWSSPAFVRIWTASTVSVFGSLVTRIALPLAAILVLGSGAVEVAILRSLDLAAALVVGLVAGAWVDRLRRRPILIWSDLGRALLLGSIPVAFLLGALTFWQLLIVTGLAAVLSTFADSADAAYLPTLVEKDELVDANSALAASHSASEFLAFGVSGFLVQALTAPVAIAIDAVSFLASALLVGSIRREEPAPPPPEAREPVLHEIREGLRLVLGDPRLRAFAGAEMALAALWGVFGATWFLFVLDELGLDPAVLGLVAGVGGASSFVGAVVASRATARFGLGRVTVAALLLTAVGNAFIPLAPAGLPVVAIACLVLQQLIGDSSAVVFEITEVSVRQTIVADRSLGRVTSTIRVASVLAQLLATVIAGVLAEAIGLRATSWLAPLGGLVAAAIVWWSPIRGLTDMPIASDLQAVEVAVETERDQPVGA